jgi:hypothetical protein
MTRSPPKKARPLVITDEQLAIYEQMKKLRCTCAPEPYPPTAEREECEDCRRWTKLNRHPAMQALVPVWEVYVVPPPSGRSRFTEQQELRQRAFEEALAEREGKTP